MSQATKTKAPSPRIKNGTPDTSFAASPFAKGAGTPSSPFKASLSAFPALPDLDEYAGFDDTWTPDFASSMSADQAGPSSRPRQPSTTSRRKPLQDGRHTSQGSLGRPEDLESFFEDGDFSDLHDKPTLRVARPSQSSQTGPGRVSASLHPFFQAPGLQGLNYFPPRPRASSVSVLTGRPRATSIQTSEADLVRDLGTPATTTYDAPSTLTESTPAMCYNRRNVFMASPTNTADTGLTSPSFSSGMVQTAGPATPGYSVLLTPAVDYSSMVRQYNESISTTRAATMQARADYEREKAEIKAHPPIAPYEVRKTMHQLAEKQRKAEKERRQAETRKEFQRAKAAADAAIAEKERIGNAEYAKLRAQDQAAADAARKVEADRRGKAEADKKAAEAKKKATEEAHKAQVKAVMAANEAASPGMTDAERQYFVAYQTHLQNGGLPLAQGEEIMRKYYSTGKGNAAIMQHLHDMDQYQRLAAQQAELQKKAQQAAEQAAQVEAARQAREAQIQAQLQAQAAVVASSPGPRLFSSPSRSAHSAAGSGVPSMPLASDPLFAASDSPNPMASVVDAILHDLCDHEEAARLEAVEAMLDSGVPVEKARTILVSKSYSPETRQIENSRMRLSASIYPFPRSDIPHLRDILHHQLKDAILHFRIVAARYGAQEVTHLFYVPTRDDAAGMGTPAARMGKISALLIQHIYETPDGPIATPALDVTKPCREYARHELPQGILDNAVSYEILIESDTASRAQ